MVKKHQIALFLNNGTSNVPDWVRIKKSTALSIGLNPETEEFDYIADQSPTTELKSVKPSLNQSLTMYTDEPDYEMIFNRFYEMKVGQDAHSEVLIVFFQEPGAGANTFKAWKSDCIISISDLDAVGSVINFDVLFGGTTDKGIATVTNQIPVFTGSATESFNFTVTVTGDDVADAIVNVEGVEKKVNASGEAVFTLIDGKKYAIAAYTDSAEGSDIITANKDSASLSIAIS